MDLTNLTQGNTRRARPRRFVLFDENNEPITIFRSDTLDELIDHFRNNDIEVDITTQLIYIYNPTIDGVMSKMAIVNGYGKGLLEAAFDRMEESPIGWRVEIRPHDYGIVSDPLPLTEIIESEFLEETLKEAEEHGDTNDGVQDAHDLHETAFNGAGMGQGQPPQEIHGKPFICSR